MQRDSIQVNGIRAYGYLGVLPEERSIGQWFEVNLTVWLDFSTAAKSDRLTDTYNYQDAVKGIQELIGTAQFQLLETTVEAIAQLILASNTSIQQVQVKLTKLTPPIAHFSGTVSVEILRSKDP
ncbi:MAG: dihydroneopterin aldolase [Oculatellaceae cyanobacterium Prado106]|nr:dihydroneopterin aldolase [Oculatellaceae cyanobacterium Prado106]